MSDCEWLSDRIPAVALGRAEWTPQEIRHLHQCVGCQQEWQVVLAASRLGEGLEVRMDTEKLSATLLQRLRRERNVQGARRKGWGIGALAAAAVLVLAIWTGTARESANTAQQNGSLVAQLEIPLPELEMLQAAELDSVLQTMDEPNIVRDPTEGDPELSELNPDELERVLDTWEG